MFSQLVIQFEIWLFAICTRNLKYFDLFTGLIVQLFALFALLTLWAGRSMLLNSTEIYRILALRHILYMKKAVNFFLSSASHIIKLDYHKNE